MTDKKNSFHIEMLRLDWRKSVIVRQLEHLDRHVGGQRIFLRLGETFLFTTTKLFVFASSEITDKIIILKHHSAGINHIKTR